MRIYHIGAIWLIASAILPASESGARYVGSKFCAGCHASVYASYVKTAMGRSLVPAEQTRDLVPAAGVNVRSGDYRFDVARRGVDLYQTESQIDAAGAEVFQNSFKLEYALGSGANGITYAVRRGAYLFEAPLSYYQRTRSWQLSPGYEATNAGFSRPMPAECVVCHSGRPQAVPERDGLYADQPFSEMSIGCENCHGPGSLHARQPSRSNIVNPAKLPARRADDVCMNCHQAGDTRVYLPGKTYADVRPGTPLSDVVAIFKIPLDPASAAPADLLEHHFSMQLSKCFTGSAGKLSCLSCHDPHAIPAKRDAPAYYEKRCLACHTIHSCKLPIAERALQVDGCIGCHMPKRDIGFISHSALTNHRIVARPDEPLPAAAFQQTTPDLRDLIFLDRSNPKPLPPMVLWKAYGELSDRAPQYQARYFQLLDTVAAQSPNDPLVQAALGRKALRDAGPESNQIAIEHLSNALKLGFTGPAAFEDLATALSSAGKFEDAIAIAKRGIELSPFAPRLHKMLILQYVNSKQYDLAKASMQRYLELVPEDAFVRDLLRKAGG